MRYFSRFLVLAFLLSPLSALAQFTSGSDESDGALNLVDDQQITLDVPPDGIFHFSTITTARGSHIYFNRNSSNGPIHFLATGDVVLRGRIHLEGTSVSSE